MDAMRERAGARVDCDPTNPPIHEAMSRNNLTHSTARKLRELALSVPEGQFLGTEKDLLIRFGVSRPTFRQAVHLVEAERIVASVRGLNGGLFSRRPDLEGVIASAATYLRSRETTLGDVLMAANSAVADAVGGAALCTDAALRAELAVLIEELAAGETVEQPLAALRKDELRATYLICRMCANPALDLMVRVFFRVGMAAFEDMFDGKAELMQRRRTARLLILRAIYANDRERALEICRRNGDLSRKRIAPRLLGLRMEAIQPGADD
ncbi:FadR/GntR family transcriptional regulator [soil metagenome]